jgi:hypothetical protein
MLSRRDSGKNWDVETLQYKYKWFPESKQSGNKRGKLLGQKGVGTAFDLFFFLYVDDGAMLFTSRKDLVTGIKAIYKHFARFGLQMHIGRGTKKSKSEGMYFAADPNNPNSSKRTGPIIVEDGQVEFTDSFKYLGSVITKDLEDSKDIDIRITTAMQAMGTLNKYFKCKQVPLEAK